MELVRLLQVHVVVDCVLQSRSLWLPNHRQRLYVPRVPVECRPSGHLHRSPGISQRHPM